MFVGLMRAAPTSAQRLSGEQEEREEGGALARDVPGERGANPGSEGVEASLEGDEVDVLGVAVGVNGELEVVGVGPRIHGVQGQVEEVEVVEFGRQRLEHAALGLGAQLRALAKARALA